MSSALLMSKKAFETVWGGLAVFYIIVTLHFVALSQGWPWYFDTGLTRSADEKTDEVVKAVAAYFGAPICAVLTLFVVRLSREYMRRHGQQSRWQRLPVPWDMSIPASDPLGRQYRRIVWLIVFLACPYGVAHLGNQTWDGIIWLECNVGKGEPKPLVAECEAAEAHADSASLEVDEVYFNLGEGFQAHVTWPPVTTDYFDHRYRFESENGYSYFPFLHALVLIAVCVWSGIELLLVWWALLRRRTPRTSPADS